MSRPSTSSIVLISGVAVVTGIVAYAAYFDYKRRNDAVFRKKLRSQKRTVEKNQAKEKKGNSSLSNSDASNEKLREIHAKINEEPLPPPNSDERRQMFIASVSEAEQLLAEGPSRYLDTAICFYQALRVYPDQMSLLMTYEKQLPEPVLKLVLELINIDAFKRVRGYYDEFPPKSMNIAFKKLPKEQSRGQARLLTLIASKSFKAGEEIYVEQPIVATLDGDLQGSGLYCSHCLRQIVKGVAIASSDRLSSVYCSKKCQTQSGIQSQNFLFGDEAPLPLPEAAGDLGRGSPRSKAQDELVKVWKNAGSGFFLVARLTVMTIMYELSKILPEENAGALRSELPEILQGSEYSMVDHLDRLRFIDVSVPEEEQKALNSVLSVTLGAPETVHTDERHTTLRGKIAYNAIGVCFGGGRSDKPLLKQTSERTRTPYGTSKQIGSGIYLFSSHLSHSCSPSVRPSFNTGTSELHLIASRDIKEGDELTMAYTDVTQHESETPSEARKRRRAELALGWKFACACEKCVEEESTLQLEDDPSLPRHDESKIDATLDKYDELQ